MKTPSITRIFVPFLLILGGAVGGALLVTPGPVLTVPLPRLLLLLAIPICAAGLFYIVLRRALRPAVPLAGEKGLSITAKELEQLKASYTTSMSHELRTSLNAIIGFTGIILQGMSGEINERQRDQLERVLNSAKRLLSMITDITNVAKIDAGEVGSSPSTFDLGTAIEEVVQDLGGDNHPDFNEIVIEVDVPHQLAMHADRKKLQQCITNLLICVVEYTDTKNITIAADKSGDCLSIIISIPRQEREQQSLAGLFRALETKKVGAGQNTRCNSIRLHLTTKMITELLGGSISVDSETGNRTSLRLNFSADMPGPK